MACGVRWKRPEGTQKSISRKNLRVYLARRFYSAQFNFRYVKFILNVPFYVICHWNEGVFNGNQPVSTLTHLAINYGVFYCGYFKSLMKAIKFECKTNCHFTRYKSYENALHCFGQLMFYSEFSGKNSPYALTNKDVKC